MSPEIGDAAEEFFEAQRTCWWVFVLAFSAGFFCTHYARALRAAWYRVTLLGCVADPYGACAERLEYMGKPNWDGVTVWPVTEIPDEPRQKIFARARHKNKK